VRFRSKIFLSVFLPSVLLVAVAAGIAIQDSRETALRSAARSLERTRIAFEGALRQQFELLAPLGTQLRQPRTEEELTLALEKKDPETLKLALEAEFSYIEMTPELWELRGSDGKLLARHPAGGGPPQAWESRRTHALAVIDGAPFAAFVYRYPSTKASLLFAKSILGAVGELKETMNIDIVLEQGGKVVYSTLPGRHPAPPGEGEVRLGSLPYLARETRPEASTLDRVVLLSSLLEVEAARILALVFGGVGVVAAALVASFVSAFLARGISRPVEALVAATKRVGEGDYAAKVEVPGRDELARLGSAFNDMTEGLRKRREIMEKTLSRDVAEELMKGVELGGERREVTVMFMDVRGFTSATQGVDPAEVVAMLNDMMAELATAIARHGGNVNKFLGDGLLAMFGAPRDLADHAWCAARAALEMQSAMAAWGAKRSGRGLPLLRIGIGLNTGIVLGGKVGSRERLEYTLIGEEVNLASRVCGKAAPGQVLATKSTAALLGERLRLRRLEPLTVKGISYPVEVFEVEA
jgi:class 3 adenylate cyclase